MAADRLAPAQASRVTVEVNGTTYEREVESRRLLIHLLRDDLDLTGSHVGCDTGNCGACSVILDATLVKSCMLLAVQVDGSSIETVEGLADGELSPLQQAFSDHHALQCGYCTPGMLMSATALLRENPTPSDDEIANAIQGNICRCTGYWNIVKAVKAVSGNAQINSMKKVAGRIKLELSQYRDLEAFAQFGSDLDADTQRTLARGARLVVTLNQDERAPLPVEDQTIQIYSATAGFLDRITVERVPEFLLGLVERMHAQHKDVREKVAGGDWSDETQKAVHDAVEAFAQDFGYDLDEEGQPLDETPAPVGAGTASGQSAGPSGAAEDGRGAGEGEQGAAESSQTGEVEEAPVA